VIADTTFLIRLLREERTGTAGRARAFLARHRREAVRTTIISLSEVAVSFPTAEEGWYYFQTRRWTIYRLHDGIAKTAADLDRQMRGQRLGENNNWIAGFCRYYREPVVSMDAAFDRVAGLRRVTY
jgi:predicted nucleic acid-binding protein